MAAAATTGGREEENIIVVSRSVEISLHDVVMICIEFLHYYLNARHGSNLVLKIVFS